MIYQLIKNLDEKWQFPTLFGEQSQKQQEHNEHVRI